jgi:hypothetical protein
LIIVRKIKNLKILEKRKNIVKKKIKSLAKERKMLIPQHIKNLTEKKKIKNQKVVLKIIELHFLVSHKR